MVPPRADLVLEPGLIILILLSNIFTVRIFAESEFWFAAVKVLAIVASSFWGR